MWSHIRIPLLVAVVVGMLGTGGHLTSNAQPVHSEISEAQPPADPTDPTEAAKEHLRQSAGSLGLRPDLSDLRVAGVRSSLSADHVRFDQLYLGLRVFGGGISVHLDKQRKASPALTNGYRAGVVVASPFAGLAASDAEAIALKHLGTETRTGRGPGIELVVFPEKGGYRAAWEVTVATQRPLGDWQVLVDAADGTVLAAFNLLRSDSYPQRER